MIDDPGHFPSQLWISVPSSGDNNMGQKLLVAGERSSAGKSTVALGLLSACLDAGFRPSELAYIKPATQCVSSTLCARWCEEHGVSCEHIGPVVFYRGYTRELLTQQAKARGIDEAGVTAADGASNDTCGPAGESSEPERTLPAGHKQLDECVAAVERISAGKKLTIIDGVGYPAVGSIVGCSSADIAVACGAPVLIVGKAGIGDAVDSFNLCARYFEMQRVPVLGGIFNKVAPTGFYGIDNCRKYLRMYMAVSRPRQRVYGLIPQHEALAAMAAEETCGIAYKRPKDKPSAGPLTAADKQVLEAVAQLFRENVDMQAILADLKAALENPAEWLQVADALPVFGGDSAKK